MKKYSVGFFGLRRNCRKNSRKNEKVGEFLERKKGKAGVLLRGDVSVCSCALTLMQKGADINGDIITNPDADKPPKSSDEEVCFQIFLFFLNILQIGGFQVFKLEWSYV